ncbi:hypothetical protein GF324_01830, partial [bacterium]|nr:hypothetical protein [bacterium]
MAQRKASKRSGSKTAKQSTAEKTITPPLWEKVPALKDSRWIIPVLLYLTVLAVWSDVVFRDAVLSVGGDRIAGVSFRRIVAYWLGKGVFPFWNPYLYGGVAMFESFQSSWLLYPGVMLFEGPFADAANPGFFSGGLAWLLFFNSNVDFILIHHLLGAVGVFLLARHFGMNAWIQYLVALAWLLSPQLVVLGDVGHGSKLYAMNWLPWALLTADRAMERITAGRLAAAGAVFAMMMASQHIQVAYYGYMLTGLWWAVRLVRNIQAKQASKSLREFGAFAFAGVMGLLATGVIYFNTLSYSQDTIRGGGLGWEYATNWSYHPLESISMFVPDFFGFGGRTYWGYLPFTDMPLYWGVPIAVLALAALLLVRTWKVWGLFVAGLLAWITSWGSFAPILYRPFYEFLPYFDKFRVPMMIHVLVLLAAVLLAGMGLQRLLEIRAQADEALRR